MHLVPRDRSVGVSANKMPCTQTRITYMINCVNKPHVNLIQCVGYDSDTACKLCCSDNFRVEKSVSISFPSLQLSRAESGLISYDYTEIEMNVLTIGPRELMEDRHRSTYTE